MHERLLHGRARTAFFGCCSRGEAAATTVSEHVRVGGMPRARTTAAAALSRHPCSAPRAHLPCVLTAALLCATAVPRPRNVVAAELPLGRRHRGFRPRYRPRRRPPRAVNAVPAGAPLHRQQARHAASPQSPSMAVPRRPISHHRAPPCIAVRHPPCRTVAASVRRRTVAASVRAPCARPCGGCAAAGGHAWRAQRAIFSLRIGNVTRFPRKKSSPAARISPAVRPILGDALNTDF